MKGIKKMIYCFIPIFVGIVFTFGLNIFLNKKINNFMNSKDISMIRKSLGCIYKDKGIVFNKYCIKNNDVLIQGSSELTSPVLQVPKQFFPIQNLNKEVSSIGRAYVQDLQHSSIIGSQAIDCNKNVAMIVSLQWFCNKDGIGCKNFQSTFSPIQFYKYLDNEKINDKNKKKYAKRINELLKESSQFFPEKIYSKLYISDDRKDAVISTMFKPYYLLRKKFVALKDKGLLYKELRRLPKKSQLKKTLINWKDEYKKAEIEGRSKVTNNKFMVYDTYFNKNIKNNLKKCKNNNNKIDLTISKEYEDYELYLDTCKDLGIKPYIIFMPTNGYWYDYIGFNKRNRDNFYNKVEKMARDRGFDVLQLKDKEYVPYFMCDTMHFGWKGWLTVDEKICEQFKE